MDPGGSSARLSGHANTVYRRTAKGLYRRVRAGLGRLVLRLRPDRTLTSFERFKRDGHAELLLGDLPLTTDSVVLEFGGYLGDYAAAVVERYGCRVHVFEPAPDFATQLQARFSGDSRVVVHAYGLAEADETRTLRMSADATGVHASGDPVQASFRSASAFARSLPGTVDLAAINIEGGEYELIPLLAATGMLDRIVRVFVQFHQLGSDSVDDRSACRAILARTHEQVWDYDFVWEAWARKPNA